MSTPKKSDEKHGQVMDLLRKHLPLDDKNEMKSVDAKFQQLFKQHPPSYEEKRTICQIDKEFIKKIGNYILEKNKLTNQISESQMYRSISKNITLFKYVVVSMESSPYSNDVKQFAEKFVKTKTTPKPLPIPQINLNKTSNSYKTEQKSPKPKDQDSKTTKICKVKTEEDKKEVKPIDQKKSDIDDKAQSHVGNANDLFFEDEDDEGSFLYEDEDNPLGYIYYFP